MSGPWEKYSGAGDDAAPVLASKDRRMQKTISDIEAGVPAAPLHWNGEPLETSAPAAGPWMKYAGEKPRGLSGDNTRKKSTLGSLAEETVATARDIGDLILGGPAMFAKGAVEAGVTALTGSAKKGLEVGERLAEQSLFKPFLSPLRAAQEGVTGRPAEETKFSELMQAAMGAGTEAAVGAGEKVGIRPESTQVTLDALMGSLGLSGFGATGKAIGKAAAKRVEGKPAEQGAGGVVPEEPAPTAPPPPFSEGAPGAKIWEKKYKEQRAERLARKFMEEGASIKTVEAAIKRDPLVGEKLAEMRQRRADAAAAFDRDFGTRQGEYLSADQYYPDFGPPGEPAPRYAPAEGMLEDLGPRFRAEAEAKEAAQAAAEAAARQPAGRERPFNLNPMTGKLEPVSRGMPGATPDSLSSTGHSLQSAAEKIASGRAFAMTAEERIAWNRNKVEFDLGMKAGGKPRGQRGSIDPRLLAGLAAAGLTYAAFQDMLPVEQNQVLMGLGLAGTVAIAPKSSLGALRDQGRYSTKVLNRLPDGRTDFKKAQIEQELRRPDVGKEEKELLTRILRDTPGDTISANELMARFRLETGDHTLQRRATPAYADLGLAGINRASAYSIDNLAGAEGWSKYDTVTTNLYRLPEGMEFSVANHFDDPRLFGWTRSFEEGGVQHVVEIQSDLAQKLKVELKPDDVPAARERQAALQKEMQRLDARAEKLYDAKDFDAMEAVQSESSKIWQAIENLDEQIKAAEASVKLSPVLKNWPRRLIREELKRAADTQRARERKAAHWERQLEQMPEGTPGWEAAAEAYSKAASEAELGKVIRFADADTVAKVEGWPGHETQLNSLRGRLQRTQERLDRGAGHRTEEDWARRKVELEEIKTALEKQIKELEGPGRFADPGHQSIYDRYKRDITKYLKSLGGKEVTDQHGHGWIEVPLEKFKGPVEMYGKADPRLLAGLAAAGITAAAFMELSNEAKERILEGLAIGGVAGITWGKGKGGVEAALKKAAKMEARAKQAAVAERVKEVETTIGQSLDNISAQARIINTEVRAAEKALPDAASREIVAEALDNGTWGQLSGPLKDTAQKLRRSFDAIGRRAVEAGVLDGLRENYITHVVDWKNVKPSAIAELVDNLIGRSEQLTGASNRFARSRKYDTFEALQAALKESGLELKTKEAPEIYRIYANAMERAIQNRRMVDSIKGMKNSEGKPFLQKVSEKKPPPRGWKYVDSPQLRGYAVDPEIYPQLKFVFGQTEPGLFLKAAHGLSQLTKRLNVVGSLFHAKSLTEASWSAVGPVKTLKDLSLAAVDKFAGTKSSGITKALEAFRQGKLGDEVDQLMRAGLQLEIPEDVTNGILAQTGKVVDELLAHVGPKTSAAEKALGTVEKYTLGVFDRFTWDYLHTGLKLNTAMHLLEKAKRDNPTVPEAELMKTIASHVNDTFGGLNWFQAAAESQSKFFKDITMAAYSKNGRMAMQVAMFAPDWTLSTLRAFTSALKFGQGTGWRGLLKPRTKADFARRYQARTALTYLTLINGVQLALTGKPLWENEDFTRIEFGDGTSMQPMKHAAEPYHWGTSPMKTLSNKIGFIPKSAVIAMTGQAYVGPTAPRLEDQSGLGRAKAIASQAAPFQVQAAVGAPKGEGMKRAALGTLGFPVYGTQKSQVKAAALKRARERAQKRKERREALK